MRVSVVSSIVVAAMLVATWAWAPVDPGPDLVAIDVSHMAALREGGLPVIWKGPGFLLARWDDDTQDAARSAGIPFEIIAGDATGDRSFFLFELHDGERLADREQDVLFRHGRHVVMQMDPGEATAWSGGEHDGVFLDNMTEAWTPPNPPPVSVCDHHELTEEVLEQTSGAQWLDWVEKLSGVDPVAIGGVTAPILSRYTSTMFAEAAHARGFDFAIKQAQVWHYDGDNFELHEFTGLNGQRWTNLIVTIPGQTAPDEIVMFTAHLDSTNPGAPTRSPGANDNGSGVATLFEAARLFRQLRFERTIKLAWFTGEEQGLLGSAAYVADHATDGIAGVVNLDTISWDGDGDRCFEIHAGALEESRDIGLCIQSMVTNYGLDLASEILTTGATTASDHASFWQADVPAVLILENFFDDQQPGGCDGGDANPWIHHVNDTIALNMTPTFGFDVARAAIATVSTMAGPIETCFEEAPVLSATPGVS
ncbi:MAG: M28 family metallopeptidase, partial [Acidobacteriota bacterium]|nr:M28 family metallopeptidase [Acidobacteriota bacterium]